MLPQNKVLDDYGLESMSMSSSLQNEATLTPGSSPCKSGDLKGGSALPPGSDGCSPVGEGPKVREAIKKERISYGNLP